jgi:antitoxin component of MazEF toxin-antitoxin module
VAKATFRAKLRPSGHGGGGHLVEVPAEVIATLGGKGRIPVTATFNGVPYRGSIVRMGESAVLGVQNAIMVEAGVSIGDTLAVLVENDDAPREVEVPPELAKALAKNASAREFFDRLSYSHQREYVGYVTEAKKPETRAKRVERTIEMLREMAAAKKR